MKIGIASWGFILGFLIRYRKEVKMTYTTIKSELKEFANKKVAYMRAYIELQEQMKGQVSGGMLGSKQAEIKLSDLKSEGEAYSRKTYEKILADIEQERTKQMQALEEKEESVTADDVAELMLIESTKNISREEFEQYLEKYKNKPLAIKKLSEIARSNTDLIFVDYEKYNQKERIEKLTDFLKQQVATFHGQLQINGDKIQLAVANVSVKPDEMAIDRYFEENGL